MSKFFWIDLEMTGLDDAIDKILEVAVLITDTDFNTVDTYHRVVYQPAEVLDAMNDWCKKTHGQSGLTAAVATGTPLETVEKELLALADKHYKPEDRIVLCGNSVGNDKRFVDRYMTEFAKRLHYRLIDISSFKEVYRDKYGLKFKKAESHRALDDIQESINELKYYLSFVTVQAPAKPA